MDDKYKVIYVKDRHEWRKWLNTNFMNEKEIWLLYPKKSSGKEKICYNDAVEEALCFGWIDSTVRSYDEFHSIQRYTPRRERSPYSQLNKERIRWLHKKEMIHYSIIESITFIINEEYKFPESIIKRLKEDPLVWENFNNFTEPYKRIRIAYIEGAGNRTEIFEQRLKYFIENTQKGKIIKGYGGTDKYYNL